MNIEPTFRAPDHSDNWIGFELSARPRVELDACGDLYGCTSCGRKSCRGRCGLHERILEPARDEFNIPF